MLEEIQDLLQHCNEEDTHKLFRIVAARIAIYNERNRLLKLVYPDQYAEKMKEAWRNQR